MSSSLSSWCQGFGRRAGSIKLTTNNVTEIPQTVTGDEKWSKALEDLSSSFAGTIWCFSLELASLALLLACGDLTDRREIKNFSKLLPFLLLRADGNKSSWRKRATIKQMLFVIMKMDLQNLFDWHICLQSLSAARSYFLFMFYRGNRLDSEPAKTIETHLRFDFLFRPPSSVWCFIDSQVFLSLSRVGEAIGSSLRPPNWITENSIIFRLPRRTTEISFFPFDFPISQADPAHKNTITQQLDKLRTRGSPATMNFVRRNVAKDWRNWACSGYPYTIHAMANRRKYWLPKSLIWPSTHIHWHLDEAVFTRFATSKQRLVMGAWCDVSSTAKASRLSLSKQISALFPPARLTWPKGGKECWTYIAEW